METLESITGISSNFWSLPDDFDYLFRKEIRRKYDDNNKLVERSLSECRQKFIRDLELRTSSKDLALDIKNVRTFQKVQIKELYVNAYIFCGNTVGFVDGTVQLFNYTSREDLVGNTVLQKKLIYLETHPIKAIQLVNEGVDKLHNYLLPFYKSSRGQS